MKTSVLEKKKGMTIIKKCHVCGQLHESSEELQKCIRCKKPFLPLNYFEKVDSITANDYQYTFSSVHELEEEDLIRGLYVLW